MNDPIRRLMDSLDHLLQSQGEETQSPLTETPRVPTPPLPPRSPMIGGGQQQISGDEPTLSAEKTLPLALEGLHNDEVRGRAVRALIRLGDAAVPALLGMMHDDDPDARLAASWALGQIKDRRLAMRLRRGAEWTYQAIAEEAGGRTVGKLIHALREGSPESAVASAVALGRLQVVRALPDLTEATNDRYPLIRLAAIWALGQIGAAESILHLADALHDPDPTIVHVAVDALNAIGTDEASAALNAWKEYL